MLGIIKMSYAWRIWTQTLRMNDTRMNHYNTEVAIYNTLSVFYFAEQNLLFLLLIIIKGLQRCSLHTPTYDLRLNPTLGCSHFSGRGTSRCTLSVRSLRFVLLLFLYYYFNVFRLFKSFLWMNSTLITFLLTDTGHVF